MSEVMTAFLGLYFLLCGMEGLGRARYFISLQYIPLSLQDSKHFQELEFNYLIFFSFGRIFVSYLMACTMFKVGNLQ